MRDHPRSRGVYQARGRVRCVERGSSPLARGLPSSFVTTILKTGIIPARAGFTASAPLDGMLPRDHPRSRGVYTVNNDVLVQSHGSSPLARGLPYHFRLHASYRRIIPARAGFTRTVKGFLIRLPDHPRSRGVYSVGMMSKSMTSGSSPLARGLQGTIMDWGEMTGIIPARAGFTASSWRTFTEPPDHPRSRGVYPENSPPRTGTNGSSPLARGLRCLCGLRL